MPKPTFKKPAAPAPQPKARKERVRKAKPSKHRKVLEGPVSNEWRDMPPKLEVKPLPPKNHLVTTLIIKPDGTQIRPLERTKPLRLCVECGGEEFIAHPKCVFCNSRDLRDALPGEEEPKRMMLAITPSYPIFVLGMTIETINRMLDNRWPYWVPRHGTTIQLWDVPRGSWVDKLGNIRTPADAKPMQLIMEIKTP